MRWVVTLEGNRPDIELLLGESGERLSASDPRRVRLAFEDPDHDLATDEARQAGKVAIDAAVRRLNGFGKLRWGRTFDGVEVKAVQCIDSSGRTQHVVFLEPPYNHMLPEDFADMVERLGDPRPELPDGIHDVKRTRPRQGHGSRRRDPGRRPRTAPGGTHARRRR